MTYTDRLNAKRIIITGGTSGIGLATARMLKQHGAQVGVLSHDENELKNVANEFNGLHADVRDETQVRTVIDAFAAEHGGIDAVVNAAGVSLWHDFLTQDTAFWDLIHDVNVKGTFIVCQAAARHMVQAGEGIILNVASMSAVKSGMPGATAYCASKWAIVGFSRNLHLELKPHGVRVSCLCPGSTQTPLHEKVGTERQDEMLEAQDIAETICFMLAAPERGHLQLVCEPAMYEDWR